MNKYLIGSLIFAALVAKSIWAKEVTTYECEGPHRIQLVLEGKFASLKLYKNTERPYAVLHSLRDVSFNGEKKRDYFRYYHNNQKYLDSVPYFLVERRLARGERSGDIFVSNEHRVESQFICKQL